MTEADADEALLLDLLNSTPVVDGTPLDLLAGQAGAVWLGEHGGEGSSLAQTRTTRDLLQDVVRGRTAAQALAPLLAGVRSVPVIEDGAVSWRIEIPKARRLAVRAVLAWDQVERVS